MNFLLESAGAVYQERATLEDEATVSDPEPMLTWHGAEPVRCACSHCGAHAYRRVRPNASGLLGVAGGPVACTVCGGNELTPLAHSCLCVFPA